MKPPFKDLLCALLVWGLFAGCGVWLLWLLNFEPIFRAGLLGLSGLVALWCLLPGGRRPRVPTVGNLAAAAKLWGILILCGFSLERMIGPFLLFEIVPFALCVLSLWWMTMEEPEEDGPRRHFFQALRFLAAMTIGGACILAIVVLPLWQGHVLFKRARFEAIVSEARRTLSPDGGGETSLRIQGYTVWAAYSEQGKLRVAILTNQRGHAGSYGFAYVEDPSPSDPLKEHIGLRVPGPLDQLPLGAQIDEHWWRVENHLD